MDKTKLKDNLKWINIGGAVVLVFLAIASINIAVTDFKLALKTLKFASIMVISLIAIVDVCIIIYYSILSYTKKENEIKNKNYVRNIPENMPVGVASLLLDFHIDNERDYIATVAVLIHKGYLYLNENGDIRVNRLDGDDLLGYERIVLDSIAFGQDYQTIEKSFKGSIRSEAKRLGVIETKEHKDRNYYIPIIVLILVFFISRQFSDTSAVAFFINLGSIVLAIMTYIVMLLFHRTEPIDERYQYKRTELGIKYAKELSGLKKFLHEYTMLKEKGLADTILYDEYIAYAIALGEAEAIEELILNNPKYKKLLYRRKPKESDNPIRNLY